MSATFLLLLHFVGKCSTFYAGSFSDELLQAKYYELVHFVCNTASNAYSDSEMGKSA